MGLARVVGAVVDAHLIANAVERVIGLEDSRPPCAATFRGVRLPQNPVPLNLVVPKMLTIVA